MAPTQSRKKPYNLLKIKPSMAKKQIFVLGVLFYFNISNLKLYNKLTNYYGTHRFPNNSRQYLWDFTDFTEGI